MPLLALSSRLETLAVLRHHADAGWLSQLDAALAAFVARHDAAARPALLVLSAFLAHLEGRGHSCLPLAALLQRPRELLAWPPAADGARQALCQWLPGLEACLAQLRASPLVRVVDDGVADSGQMLVLAGSAGSCPMLYLRRYWQYERRLARLLAQRLGPLAESTPQTETALRQCLHRLFPPAQDPPAQDGAPDWQKLACALAWRGRLTLITGGPGTGKTHTAARLLALLWATAQEPGSLPESPLRVALAAPTGKAAARLEQSIRAAWPPVQAALGAACDLSALAASMGKAQTLHALLGERPHSHQRRFHAARPLDVDVLVLDEASMIDLEMMVALLDALPPRARLILLGDKNQLASVQAGSVLGDLCQQAQAGHYDPATRQYARRVAGIDLPAQFLAPDGPPADAPLPRLLAQHTVMLRTSHRFGGDIAALARAVHAGDAAAAQHLLHAGTAAGAQSALWSGQGHVQAVAQLACHGRGPHPGYGPWARLLGQGPQKADGMDEAAHRAWVLAVLRAFERFRLLCAVREGDWGVAGINHSVEQALAAQGHIRPGRTWYAGRPVMVTRNDAALQLSNGDVGMALPAPPSRPGGLRVYFLHGEDDLRSVSAGRLAHVQTAFAMTVHKSQGSEFEHCALVLPTWAGSALSRELLYTGITRARSALTLFAQDDGLLAQAVGRPTERFGGLLRF